MTGPPDNVEAAELWRKLQERPRPSECVDFPRYGEDGKAIQKIRIMVLPMKQHDLARERAFRSLTARRFKPEDLSNVAIQEVYGDAIARETLAEACVSVNPIPGSAEAGKTTYMRLFKDADQLNEMLTADEITVLWTAWRMVQLKFGPTEDTITSPEQITEWVQRLVEGAAADPLLRLTWPALLMLTASLAGRVYLLSAALDSQFSDLPDTFKSALEKSPLGIASCSWLPVSFADGLTIDREQLQDDDDLGETEDWSPLFSEPEEPITIEDAGQINRRLRGEE